jgi:hypothetical protein
MLFALLKPFHNESSRHKVFSAGSALFSPHIFFAVPCHNKKALPVKEVLPGSNCPLILCKYNRL